MSGYSNVCIFKSRHPPALPPRPNTLHEMAEEFCRIKTECQVYNWKVLLGRALFRINDVFGKVPWKCLGVIILFLSDCQGSGQTFTGYIDPG